MTKLVPVVPEDLKLPGASHGAGHVVDDEEAGEEPGSQVTAHLTLWLTHSRVTTRPLKG